MTSGSRSADGHARFQLVLAGADDVPFEGHGVYVRFHDREHPDDVAVGQVERLAALFEIVGVDVEDDLRVVVLQPLHLDAPLEGRRGEAAGHPDEVEDRLLAGPARRWRGASLRP